MGVKRQNSEKTIAKLREAKVLLGQGVSVGEMVRKLGVTQVTYYRRRKEYDGIQVDKLSV